MTTVETLLNDPDPAGVWNLVPDRSTITFKIRNMWGLINVKGRFTDFNGDGQLTGKGAVFGRLDIRTASLHTGIGRRDEHLRSADFFDVERFPEISVVVTAVQPTTATPPTCGPTSPSKGSPPRCRCPSNHRARRRLGAGIGENRGRPGPVRPGLEQVRHDRQDGDSGRRRVFVRAPQ